MPPTPLTVSRLARAAGVSAQTLRHYDRLGLLRPRARSAAGYRLYDEGDRARLELIRALRALDLDLATIGRLLAGAASVRAVAELHLRTLDHHHRALVRRRAVMRVLLRGDAPLTTERMRRLQALADVEHSERAGFIDAQLGARLRGTAPAGFQRAVRAAAAVELPESPTDAQVEAWLELAEMVTDESFLARHRGAPSRGTPAGRDAGRWMRDANALFAPAARAARAGLDPAGTAARPVVRRWVRAMLERQGRPLGGRRVTRDDARALLAAIERASDPREARFWELLAELRPEIAASAISVAWPWLMRALRRWAEG